MYASLITCRLNVLLDFPQEYRYIPINGEPHITDNNVPIREDWSTFRVVPTSNIGHFVPAVSVTPVIGSYATTAGLIKVPVMNHKKNMVPSKFPKFPTLSDKSKLTVYISSHPIHGLPKCIGMI